MEFFNLVIFFFLVFFDARLLRQQDARLFQEVFRFPRWLIWTLAVFVAGAFFWTHDWSALSFCVAVLFLVYLMKRHRFKKRLVRPVGEPRPLDLASDALGMIWYWGLGLVVCIVMIKTLHLTLPPFDSQLGQLVISSALSNILMMGLMYLSIRKSPGTSFSLVLGLRRQGQPFWKLIAVPVLMGALLAALSSFIVLSRSVQPMTPLNRMVEATNSSAVFFGFMAVAILLAPFFEEVIFRGYFYYVIERFKGRTAAFLLIAFTFGLLHVHQYWGDWAAIAIVSFLGFVLTFLRVWTGTSIASMVMHYTYNGLMTFIPIAIVIFSNITNPVYLEYQWRFQQLQPQEKEALLLESIERFPEHAASYNDLAWLYTQEDKNLELALTLVEKALALQPGEFAFLDTQAEVLYKLGRVEEAVVIAAGLVEEYPESQYARDQLLKFKKALSEKEREGPAR